MKLILALLACALCACSSTKNFAVGMAYGETPARITIDTTPAVIVP